MEFFKENRVWFTLIMICIAVISATLVAFFSREEEDESLLLDIPVVLDQSVMDLVDAYATVEEIHPVDENPPLLLGGTNITVKLGASGVPGPMLCIDDYDRSVECRVEGQYDLNTLGTYNLKWVATDSAGNVAEKEFTLNVVEEVSGTNGETVTAAPLPIGDAIERYKTEETRIGIDVSKWQGDIDWQKVADSGVEFVVIRLGVQDGFGGDNTLDSYFLENYKGAKKAGLDVGVYYYSYSTTLEESAKQAFFVLETIQDNNIKLDLPVVYDWESWNQLSSLGMSLNDLNDCANIFLEIMSKAGLQASLYSSKYYLSNGIWKSNYPIWLAHYTSETDYEGKYDMWQCSCTGRVPGIAGDVDINVLFKDSNKEVTTLEQH